MWHVNALTERLNLKWPILQAPMGSASTPALAAAVTNAGGLGGLGMWGRTAEQAGRRIAGFRQQSGGSLNVNYPLWPEPEISPDISEPMRARLQAHFEASGLGAEVALVEQHMPNGPNATLPVLFFYGEAAPET